MSETGYLGAPCDAGPPSHPASQGRRQPEPESGPSPFTCFLVTQAGSTPLPGPRSRVNLSGISAGNHHFVFLSLGEFFRAKKQTTLKAKLGALGGGHLRGSEGQRGGCRGVGFWGWSSPAIVMQPTWGRWSRVRGGRKGLSWVQPASRRAWTPVHTILNSANPSFGQRCGENP